MTTTALTQKLKRSVAALTGNSCQGVVMPAHPAGGESRGATIICSLGAFGFEGAPTPLEVPMSMRYVYGSERPMPRLIALEEAFWLDDLQRSGSFANVNATMRRDRLEDLGRRLSDFTEYRLPEMDHAGVDVQVLSLTSPGIQMQSDVEIAKSDARKANDQLLKVIAEHPTRFAGFAALPLQDVPAAIEELRRTVGLGLCGALVNDHTLGHYLDEPQFDPFWMALEDLDVPLYIHPSAAPIDWGITPNSSVRLGAGRRRPEGM